MKFPGYVPELVQKFFLREIKELTEEVQNIDEQNLDWKGWSIIGTPGPGGTGRPPQSATVEPTVCALNDPTLGQHAEPSAASPCGDLANGRRPRFSGSLVSKEGTMLGIGYPCVEPDHFRAHPIRIRLTSICFLILISLGSGGVHAQFAPEARRNKILSDSIKVVDANIARHLSALHINFFPGELGWFREYLTKSLEAAVRVIAHPIPANDQWVAGFHRPARASRMVARALRPLRRPVETMEQRSA
jgi:hypothetical protein